MSINRYTARIGAAALLALVSLPSAIHGHGYLKTPRSRNFVAYEDGVWSPSLATNPLKESEPQSANTGGTLAQCGIIAGRNYDVPKNAIGGDLSQPRTQACYQPGSVIDVEVTLTAHHKGHFEFKACPVVPYQVPTQACFDEHPMTFVSDPLYGANLDVNYPERAYIPTSGLNFSYKFKLPDGMSADMVLIQWRYITANSCYHVGYETYDWPVGPNWPSRSSLIVSPCGPLPPDGKGVPEQFWNCAEVKVAADCAAPPSPTPPTITTSTTVAPPQTTTSATTPTASTTVMTTSAVTTINPSCPATTASCGPSKTCASLGWPTYCCSQWGYCGTGVDFCGTCCQNGPCTSGPSPPPPPPPPPSPPSPPSGFNYNANHGEDSRLIAYVSNWQACPTPSQYDAYSHLVIAFAVSYTWAPTKNNCDTQCTIASTVPICNNQNNQALVDTWRAAGKKVILSIGGAGMGGSWSGDQNNCWDYCFGKEEQLATNLVSIINDQKFDGIDIDYEYCYDINGSQAGRCPQRSASYTDLKAQTFLDSLTSKLRVKLDALQVTNGYNRGRYLVTHAPMDSDLTPSTSKYFQILKARRADLDFLLPQFYNGVTKAHVDGFSGSGAGAMSAASLFSSLANDLFNMEPNKVVFGFCVSDCSATGSNANAAQAVKVMSDLKIYNNGQFSCNGGAFFWVAEHDTSGTWSDAVVAEVSKTAGCSSGFNTTTSTTVSPPLTTTAVTTTAATTAATTTTVMTTPATTTAVTTTAATTAATTTTVMTTLATTTAMTTTAVTTTNPSCPAVTASCGPSKTCASLGWPTYCCSQWGYCGAGVDYCGTCCQNGPCTSGPSTMSSPPTSSKPTSPSPPPTSSKPTSSKPTTLKPTSSKPTSSKPTTLKPTSSKPTTSKPGSSSPTTAAKPTSTSLVISRDNRCGKSEIDARETCGPICTSSSSCPSGSSCYSVNENFCGSIPQRTYTNPQVSTVNFRCGVSEIHARTFCGISCTWSSQCNQGIGETCHGVHPNYCGSSYT